MSKRALGFLLAALVLVGIAMAWPAPQDKPHAVTVVLTEEDGTVAAFSGLCTWEGRRPVVFTCQHDDGVTRQWWGTDVKITPRYQETP